jgi:hypothetical protein
MIRSWRIIVVATLALLLAGPVLAHGGGDGTRLEIEGHRIVDDTLMVSVRNPGTAAQQAVLYLIVGFPNGSYSTGVVVMVPPGGELLLPVRFPPGSIPIRLIHLGLDGDPMPTDPPSSEAEENGPSGSGGGGGGGNQITEGPDPI